MTEAELAREIASLVEGLRKQYSFRDSDRALLAWDVHRLIVLSRAFPIEDVSLDALVEYDELYWYGYGARPTVRSVVEHMRLIEAADFDHPILLDQQGRIFDGMHRVAKAHLEGRRTIAARRFAVDPEPDFVGREPDDLPY